MEADRHGKAYRAVIKRMGSDGKLGVGWPKEFGGLGFGPIEQSIFVNEAHRADVPLPAVTLQTVGPTLQAYGTELQKKKFLPGILAGEVHFAIGYTEPEAGTDLASLRTTAVRHGDEYIVNGQKVFTTGGHDADYVWLACRTDPEAAKHKGISMLIVDTTDPGYSWTPMILSDGAHHTNATYYNDVRVPADMLVGEENGGWRLITTQLNNERVMLGPAGRFAALYDRIHAWASKPGSNGDTPLDHDDVKRSLGELKAMWRINELLNWQVAASGETIDVADAAATKVFGTERIQYAGRLAEEIVGTHGNPADPDTAELLEWLDSQTKRNLVITFGGGVNEVMREMIGSGRGLGVPAGPERRTRPRLLRPGRPAGQGGRHRRTRTVHVLRRHRHARRRRRQHQLQQHPRARPGQRRAAGAGRQRGDVPERLPRRPGLGDAAGGGPLGHQPGRHRPAGLPDEGNLNLDPPLDWKVYGDSYHIG